MGKELKSQPHLLAHIFAALELMALNGALAQRQLVGNLVYGHISYAAHLIDARRGRLKATDKRALQRLNVAHGHIVVRTAGALARVHIIYIRIHFLTLIVAADMVYHQIIGYGENQTAHRIGTNDIAIEQTHKHVLHNIRCLIIIVYSAMNVRVHTLAVFLVRIGDDFVLLFHF